MAYLILATGIALLFICGDLLVRGAVALAVRLSVPALVIGLTIVAFGTSAPELVVSLRAALVGSSGVAIGNVVGSNIANVLLVLGLPALISATNCNHPFIRRNMFYVIAASLLFIWLCFNGPLTFWHGAILFSLILLFLVESGRRAQHHKRMAEAIGSETMELIEGNDGLHTKPGLTAFFLLVGLVGLPIGAHLTVSAAVEIAHRFGVSEAVIGLTVVALGTSLPELATTVVAAVRGHYGLALGNVLGSNLFNLLAIMGLTAMVAPVAVPDIVLRQDLWVMLAATLALTPFVLQKASITRLPAALFVLAYFAYIYFLYFPPGTDLAALAGF